MASEEVNFSEEIYPQEFVMDNEFYDNYDEFMDDRTIDNESIHDLSIENGFIEEV